MLALRRRRLELVVRLVDQLAAGGSELAELSQVNVDHDALGEELAGDLEDVAEHSLECAFVDIDALGNGSVGGLRLDVGLHTAEVGVLGLVLEAVAAEEVLGELDERDAHVVAELLVSDDTEAGDVDGTTLVELSLRPLGERPPHKIVGGLGDHGTRKIGVAAEVPLDGLVAEARNIELETGGLLLPVHWLHYALSVLEKVVTCDFSRNKFKIIDYKIKISYLKR